MRPQWAWMRAIYGAPGHVVIQANGCGDRLRERFYCPNDWPGMRARSALKQGVNSADSPLWVWCLRPGGGVDHPKTDRLWSHGCSKKNRR